MKRPSVAEKPRAAKKPRAKRVSCQESPQKQKSPGSYPRKTTRSGVAFSPSRRGRHNASIKRIKPQKFSSASLKPRNKREKKRKRKEKRSVLLLLFFLFLIARQFFGGSFMYTSQQ